MNTTPHRTKAQRDLRNRQIVASRIRHAAELLETAMRELNGAQHDADTSGLEIDLIDAVKNEADPAMWAQTLDRMADGIWIPVVSADNRNLSTEWSNR